MKHPKPRKDLVPVISITLIYLALMIFQYHLDRIFPGLPIRLITWGFFFVMVALLIAQVFRIIKKRKKTRGSLKWANYFPSLILAFGILYTFSPVKLDSEKMESKVIFRGCYEGNAERAVIRFRSNKSFEINWTSEGGTDDWYFGTYIQHSDTLFLSYEEKSPEKVGGIILNTGQSLVSINKPQHSEKYYVLFTLGYCKDSNGN